MGVVEPAGFYLLIGSTLSLLATVVGCWRIQLSPSWGHARKAVVWTSVFLTVALLALGIAVLNYGNAPESRSCAVQHARFGC